MPGQSCHTSGTASCGQCPRGVPSPRLAFSGSMVVMRVGPSQWQGPKQARERGEHIDRVAVRIVARGLGTKNCEPPRSGSNGTPSDWRPAALHFPSCPRSVPVSSRIRAVHSIAQVQATEINGCAENTACSPDVSQNYGFRPIGIPTSQGVDESIMVGQAPIAVDLVVE